MFINVLAAISIVFYTSGEPTTMLHSSVESCLAFSRATLSMSMTAGRSPFAVQCREIDTNGAVTFDLYLSRTSWWAKDYRDSRFTFP